MFSRTHNVANLSRLAGLAAAAAAAAPAISQPIAYEGFNYPSLASLVGQNSGIGFAAPWQSAGYGSWSINSSDSLYIKNGLSLLTSGRRATATQGGFQRLLNLATPIGNSPGTVWISFIAQQDAGVAAQSWLGVTLPTSGSANPSLFLGKPYGQPNWGSDAGLEGSIRQTTKSAKSQALIVARIDTRNGADDVYMWVNPSLASAPSTATADLVLPAYGNFQGITKVLIETGSTGPIASSGTIDEIRLGNTFADVAPVKPSITIGGFASTPIGAAAIAQEFTVPPMLSVTHIGGTGQDGVRVNVNSLSGFGIEISPDNLSPGASINASNVNWNGQILSSTTVQRVSANNYQLVADYSGDLDNPVTSVRMSILDAAGNVVQDSTMSGAIGSVVTDPVISGWISGLCADGSAPAYYYTETYDPALHMTISKLVLGCRFGWPNLGALVINAEHVACSNCQPVSGAAGGTHHVNVTAANMSGFQVSGAAAEFHGAMVSGLGDAFISQSCSGGSDCSDPNLQQVSIGNIGGTGNDGVRIEPAAPGDIATMQYALGGLTAISNSDAGRLTASLDARTISGQTRQVSVRMQRESDKRVHMTVDASAIGATMMSYTLSNDGVVVASGEGPTSGFECFVYPLPDDGLYHPKTTFTWLPWWWIFPHATVSGALQVPGAGGGTVSGNELNIQFLNGEQIASFDAMSLTGKDLTNGLIDISNLLLTAASNPCPVDFDQDGTLDFFDYDAFVNAFENGDAIADFDQDGTTDFFDYDAFVHAFEAGC